MQIYNSFEEIQRDDNTVLTLGAFDGVHRGHREVLGRLLDIAKESNMRHVVITLDPHPQVILPRPGKSPFKLLTSIKERLELFEDFGIEHVLIIPFSYEFSQTEPEQFIREYLHKYVGIKKILIGHDHLFGKNREGNEELLKQLSQELNFEIERTEAFSELGTVISSTKIRHLLEECKIETANEMLGYTYIVRGKVVHGNGRGASLGYPTANIKPPYQHKLLPGNGVYLVQSTIDGTLHYGMANIGTRPTVTNDTKPILEVNYLDFDADLYGDEISVHFLKFIRNEVKFKNLDGLLNQIEKDERQCRDLIEQL